MVVLAGSALDIPQPSSTTSQLLYVMLDTGFIPHTCMCICRGLQMCRVVPKPSLEKKRRNKWKCLVWEIKYTLTRASHMFSNNGRIVTHMKKELD